MSFVLFRSERSESPLPYKLFMFSIYVFLYVYIYIYMYIQYKDGFPSYATNEWHYFDRKETKEEVKW